MRLIIIFWLTLLAGPAVALQNCDEWWFTRNLIFDRAGYCFDSALGRAVFDNAGCRPGAPDLDPASKQRVTEIQALEQQWACTVDTAQVSLAVPNIQARLQMQDIPVPDEFESACIGWRGTDVPLRAARNEAAPVTGVITAGEDIYFAFWNEDGWDFILSQDGSPDMGWMRTFDLQQDSCDSFAG